MISINEVVSEGEELDIVRDLFSRYQDELDEDLCFQRFDDELRDPLKKYSPPQGIIFLARFQQTPAGCIALSPLDPVNGRRTCEMKRLYVLPAFREHHIGRALIERLFTAATAMRYDIMMLDTLEKLQPAIHLYHKYGFTETTSYYQNPLPGVVYMQKML